MADGEKDNRTLRRVQAVTRGDPLGNPADGTKISAQVKLVFPSQTNGVEKVQNWDAFDGALLQILFDDGARVRVTGSAVMVAPGVALAAWHVLEPEIETIQARESTVLLSAFTSGQGLSLWSPIGVSSHPDSDVVILSVIAVSDLPADNVLQIARLSTRTPRVGEKVMICGFRAAESEFPLQGDGHRFVEGSVFASAGTVGEVFPMGRDKALIRWPSFAVECDTVGSMSGGPVFDESGSLVGLLAAGLDSPEKRGPSYVSLLWPALGRRFFPKWLPGAFGEETSLLQMAGRGCFMVRPEAIAVTPEGHISYTPWS